LLEIGFGRETVIELELVGLVVIELVFLFIVVRMKEGAIDIQLVQLFIKF